MRITTIAVVIGLVLIAFVGVETSVAHGLDFMRLQNGTQVPNSLGIGAPNSTGVAVLPNGTFAAFIDGGGPGSTIGPVHVYRSDDGKHVWASAHFNVRRPSGNVTGNATEGSATIHVGPPPLAHQIAKAETDCSRTDLTQDERYTCGYNRGYLDARTDWNFDRFPPESGGDNSCPHATEHTPEYCNGYAKGYTYEWNTLYQGQQTPTGPSLDTLYSKGLSLYHQGNYTGAIEYLDRALAVDPNDKDALYYKGEVLFDLGNYTGAMSYYDRVLAIDPHDVNALNNKGSALENLGNNTGAILYYDKALVIDPHYDTALNNKGAALDNLGNHTGAILYYDKALDINPKYEDALFNKGYDLAALGNYTGAILYYDKALAINPKDVDALTNKGVALDSLGNHTGAIENYDKALVINPKYENALADKGMALGSLGNFTGAIEYYDKALAIDPHDVNALNNKGVILNSLRNYTGAIEYYDKALAIQPNDNYTLNNKGLLLNSLGNYSGAILYYDKVLAIDPSDENVLFNKGVALDNVGNYIGAIKYYDKALAIDSKYVYALNNKGNALANLGNHSGAIEYYDKASAINPKYENALYNKGTALDNLGDYTGALISLDKALAIDPKDEDALYNKGVVLDNLGNPAEAILYYDKALAVEPNDTYPLTGKGDALEDLRNYTGAILYYDKALAIDPKYVDALNNKGFALDNLGNHTGAILYYDKALEIQPNDTYALNDKGAALNSLGNYTGAILYYNKALAIDPKDTFALTNKAAILDILVNNTALGNPAKFLQYRNSIYGIKMQYPSEWRVKGGSNPSIVGSFYPQRDYRSDVIVVIENLTTNYTPDQFLNSLMLGDAADYKNFPDMRFNQNTTNNIVIAGHPGYLLNGTFRDPASDALQKFTNIGTIIGDKVYSVIYYSPAETYPVHSKTYLQMIKSFEVVPPNISKGITPVSTYDNSNYGVQIQYPSDWSVQESKPSGELINIATFISPTGPDSNPTATAAIYIDRLHNSTTTPNSYAHFVAFTDYENNFHDFKLLELSTTSSILGKSAYALIGTYQDPSAGSQKIMEVGTIIGDKAYSVQYIADAPRYSDYLPAVQKMIESMHITSQGNGIRGKH